MRLLLKYGVLDVLFQGRIFQYLKSVVFIVDAEPNVPKLRSTDQQVFSK